MAAAKKGDRSWEFAPSVGGNPSCIRLPPRLPPAPSTEPGAQTPSATPGRRSGHYRAVASARIGPDQHDEDTTLHVVGQTITMTDRMGRSFEAKLDGTDANGGKVVKICTWSVRIRR